jgi:3-oxoacyl-(acyl-carrier-protein) synthase
MKQTIVITDMAGVSPFGLDIDAIFNNSVLNKKSPLIQTFNHIVDFNFYEYQYDVKTKIDICSQLCIHTSAQLMRKNKMRDNNMIGLITASKYGCPIAASKYLEQLKTLADPQYASPKDFVQSICNIPNAQTSILCGIKGITNHYSGGADASLIGIWQAVKSIKDGLANEMIVAAFDVLCAKQKRKLAENNCQNIRYIEAAASIRLQASEDINISNACFKILGIGFGAIQSALHNALKDANITEKDVSFIVSNCNTMDEFANNEVQAIESIFSNPIPTCMLKSYIGESATVFPILAIGILSKFSGRCLPSNLFNNLDVISDQSVAKYLIYENIIISTGSVLLIIGYGDFGNAVVICLQYVK